MNYRQAKKKMYHKTMKRGGWKAYKDLMKKSGFWNLNFNMDMVNTIQFNGKTYLTREVEIDGEMRLIADEDLEKELIVNDKYVSEEAKMIDEMIYGYVEVNDALSDKKVMFDLQ